MLRQAATNVYRLLRLMVLMVFAGLGIAILLGVLAHLYSSGDQEVVYSTSRSYGADPAVTKWKQNVEQFLKEAGDRAAEFVVPERRFGHFSPAAMTAFYGALPDRLQAISLGETGPNTFLVRYRFRSKGGLCSGRGLVSTVSRDGANYVSSIQAPEGC
jgi:hypothetical protein